VRSFIDRNGRSEEPFFLVDLEQAVQKFNEWREYMPRVEPYYAVKCNPTPALLRTLKNLGVHFDCASKEEIEAVFALGGDIDPENDIIYANPTKPRSHLLAAKKRGVKMMTFDNPDELHKIKQTYPEAQLVLRIMTDDSKAVCRLSSKYGAPLGACSELLKLALDLNLNVIGVSFHVGSGQQDPSAFADAIHRAARVFDMARELGITMNLLDIGGGFPGVDDEIAFPTIAAHMRPKIDELFPEHVRVIAEPGRYFATACFTLVCNVIARRDVSQLFPAEQILADEMVRYFYYINDGVYGSFNCIMFDHATAKPKALDKDGPTIPCTFYGPTCDALDCIAKGERMPLLNVGDWVYFTNMGSYTLTAASTFNGFQKPNLYYIRKTEY
jgi:ornithine decarboxylase